MRCKLKYALPVLMVFLLALKDGWAYEPRVLVVTTSGVEPFLLAAQSARKLLLERWPTTPPVIVIDKNMSLPSALTIEQDDIVIAVGSGAIQSSVLEKSAGIVGCMTLTPQVTRNRRTLASLILEFPPDIQIDWLRRVLPAARTLSLLYAAAEAQGRPEALVAAARRKGLEVSLFPLMSGADLQAALERAVAESDVVMTLADTLTMAPQSAKQMLLSGFRHKVPVVGLSDPWVKAGALYALDWDFEDIGRQCAQMAIKPGSALVYPRSVRLSLNQRTARYLKIEPGELLLKQAAQVYQ